MERIFSTPYFAPVHNKLKQLLDPATFVGRAPQQVLSNALGYDFPVLQVDKFLTEEVKHHLEPYEGQLDHKVTLDV